MSIQTTDPVADLLTRIRNAIAIGKNEVRVPTSKLKFAVADKLQKTNYLEKVEVEDAKPRGILHIVINNEGENARINEIEKVSTPGRRIYAGVSEIPKVKSGRGTVLVSTSKGIMTGQEAVKNKLGGEILVKVW
jgi:small subunit ribosomal protein S8